MAKKFEKKLLSSAVALALGVGLSGNAAAIHVAEDGKGQLLMSAIYMADYGYTTKVAVTNTRDDVAVKVRVALRSQKFSDEFDFICLMSPSDVCRFEIVREGDQAYLTSTDDSILADDTNPIFASQCATQNGKYCKDGKLWVKVYDWHIRTTKEGTPIDMNEIGHMEVLGVWGAKGRIYYSDTAYVDVKEAMSKTDLYKIMGPKAPPRVGQGQVKGLDSFPNNNGTQNELNSFADGRVNAAGNCVTVPFLYDVSDVGGSDVRGDYHGSPCSTRTGAAPASRIRSTDPSWVQLTGEVQLDNGADRMGLRMTALDGDIWDNLTPGSHKPAYGMYSYSQTVGASSDLNGDGVLQVGEDFSYAFDGRVISNPSFQVTYGAEVRVGEAFGRSRAGFGAVATAYDNIVEIENALATQQVQGAFENVSGDLTNLIITFPTKYRHDSSNNFYREGMKEMPGYTGPVGPISLGDADDKTDVCASELTAVGGHASGDARLHDGRVFYAPFRPEGSLSYNLTVWNDQEVRDPQTICSSPIFSPGLGNANAIGGACDPTVTDEVNYHWVTWPDNFTKGWFSLSLMATPGCQYKGVPALVYAHKTQNKSGQFINSWLMPLASENDSRVPDTADTASTELTSIKN